jgi:hypothetical protein
LRQKYWQTQNAQINSENIHKYLQNRSNLLQLGVGGNDVPKNAPLTLMKYKCFLCGIPKARKTCKTQIFAATESSKNSLQKQAKLIAKIKLGRTYCKIIKILALA